MLKNTVLMISLIALMAIMATSLAVAQSGGIFDLFNSTIDDGGGDSTGGNFALSGTIGQHDASELSSGGEFTLNGGFWNSDTVSKAPTYTVNLPMLIGP